MAVLLYGFGGLMVASALSYLAAACVVSLFKREPIPSGLILALLGHLGGGLLWIWSGTDFRKHRSLRGVLLAVVGYLLGVGSAMLMQAAVD